MNLRSMPELHRTGDWWDGFIREMKAIGCINIRQAEDGEWSFDCPAANVGKAKKIVAKYKARE